MRIERLIYLVKQEILQEQNGRVTAKNEERNSLAVINS